MMKVWTVSHWYDNDPVCEAIFDTEEAAIAHALEQGRHGDDVTVWTVNEPGSDFAVGSVVNYKMGPTAEDPPWFVRA